MTKKTGHTPTTQKWLVLAESGKGASPYPYSKIKEGVLLERGLIYKYDGSGGSPSFNYTLGITGAPNHGVTL